MIYAMKVDAGLDRNGNGREGWLCYNADGDTLGFLDRGCGRLSKEARIAFPRHKSVVDLGTIPTTASFLRGCRHMTAGA